MTDTQWKKVFCQNLLYLRLQNKLTQLQMAEIIGIGVSRLRQIEAGNFPTHLNAAHLCRIADHFSLPTDALFQPLDAPEQ